MMFFPCENHKVFLDFNLEWYLDIQVQFCLSKQHLRSKLIVKFWSRVIILTLKGYPIKQKKNPDRIYFFGQMKSVLNTQIYSLFKIKYF